jgi:hypothetical protein
MYPNGMNFYWSPQTKGLSEDDRGEPRIFASTADGVVSGGDLSAMRHWMEQAGHGDAALKDEARNALFEAASNALVMTGEKRVMNMRLYALPLVIEYSRGVGSESSKVLASKKSPHFLLKLREVWSRIFGASSNIYVAPIPVATHNSVLLSLNPKMVRDCVRRGAEAISGAVVGPWQFDEGKTTLFPTSPEVPACYVLTAYVCWDVGSPEPTISTPSDVMFDLYQTMRAFFSASESQCSVSLGRPGLLHDAVTQAHGLQVSAMLRRGTQIGHSLGLEYAVNGDRSTLKALYFSESFEEDPTFEQSWSYSNVWRPSSHVEAIAEMMKNESLAIAARAKEPYARNSGRNDFPGVQVH